MNTGNALLDELAALSSSEQAGSPLAAPSDLIFRLGAAGGDAATLLPALSGSERRAHPPTANTAALSTRTLATVHAELEQQHLQLKPAFPREWLPRIQQQQQKQSQQQQSQQQKHQQQRLADRAQPQTQSLASDILDLVSFDLLGSAAHEGRAGGRSTGRSTKAAAAAAAAPASDTVPGQIFSVDADVSLVRDPVTHAVAGWAPRSSALHALSSSSTAGVSGAGASTSAASMSMAREPGRRSDFVRGKIGQLPFAPGGLDAAAASANIQQQQQQQHDEMPFGSEDDVERELALVDELLRLTANVPDGSVALAHGDRLQTVAPGFARGMESGLVSASSASDTAPRSTLDLDTILRDSDALLRDLEAMEEVAMAQAIEDESESGGGAGAGGGSGTAVAVSGGAASSTATVTATSTTADTATSTASTTGATDTTTTTTTAAAAAAAEAPVSSQDTGSSEEPTLSDDLLEVAADTASAPSAEASAAPAAAAKREWAHMIDISTGFSNFHELVPAMARQFPFELDVFQKQAVYHLEQGDSVFVAAHTSAGKTVVAEYAIALSMKHMTKTIYTSPIKALSNQKFRDFCKTFGDDNVGILTGDIQIRPEAPCVVMTTEILRSMLYRGADIIRDIEYVVFDEVHYVNDLERGVVWEEVIIMLPAHVSLILLSATVPNTREFADWVGRTKKKDIYVISTLYRPVPLEHYLFAGGALHKVVDAKRQLLTSGWKAANDAIAGDAKLEKQQQQQQQQRGGGGGGGSSRGGRGGGGGAVVRTGGGPMDTRAKQDRTLYAQLVSYLRKHELLPVVVFTFSRRRCEENAGGLTNVDLLGSSQKSEVHVFIEKSLQRLKPADRTLPQIVRMRDLLGRGIAVHHGGLLPIIKEIVEILFARGLVKVLFATETFAMGVNFPARSVVFSSLRKHDGRTFRELLPGEYTQMSGRAGRRGLDATGVVIIMCQPGGGGGFGGFGRGGSGSDGAIPDTTTLTTMILGPSTKLVSQFRLTYTMILNLLRVEQLKVEEMIKRSFSENTAQKQLPEQQRALEDGRHALERLERQMECVVCRPDIGMYHSLCVRVSELTQAMLEMALASPVGYRALAGAPGRIVVLAHANPLLHGCFAVILRPSAERVIVSSGAAGGTTGQVPAALHCLVLMDAESSAQYLQQQQQQQQQQQRAVAGSDSNLHSDSNGDADDVDADDTLPLVPPVLEWPRALDPAMARHAVVAVELSNIGFVVDSSLRVPELAAAASEPVGAKHSEAWERACVVVRDELVRTASSLFTAHADDGAAIEDSHAGLDRLLALEYPFGKLRDLEFKRRYAERRLQLHRLASAFGCRGCPDLAAHLQLTHREQTLRARLAALVHAMSDQNLELLPDYRQRLHVLRRLGFIAPIQTYESRRRQQQQQHGGGGGDNGDDDGALAAGLDAVQLKGRIGCEIHAADELILTELVLSNFFADLAPEEAAALLSAFVCHEKSDYEPVLTPRLELGARQMVETAERIVTMERECGLYSSASLTSAADSAAPASTVSAPAAAQSTDAAAGAELAPAMSDMATEVASRMRFTLTEVVYEWARGMPFTQLMSLTDVQEGHIVRCIVRLDDVCTEVRDAAWIIGDRALFAKMQQASAMIKRDIVFAASLYFDKAFAMRSANLSAKAAVATIESAAAAAVAGEGSGTDAAKSRGAAQK